MKKLVESHTKVINELKSVIEKRDRTIETLRIKLDDLQQYQRRSCLCLFRVEETNEENTDDIAVKVGQKTDVQLTINDIDRSHRVGISQSDRPRPIIIRLASYGKSVRCSEVRKIERLYIYHQGRPY